MTTAQLAILLPLLLLVHTCQPITLHKETTPINNTPRSSASGKKEEVRFNPFDSNVVSCSDKTPICECPNPEEETCTFSELEVTELQTFVSYKYEKKEEKVPVETYASGTKRYVPPVMMSLFLKRLQTKANKHDSPGDVYYLSGRGFTTALPPKPHDEDTFLPPEYGKCFFSEQITNDQFFEDHNCSSPATVDGVTYRMYIGVNGQMPGPTLIAYENQVVKIRVRNKLTSEAISVHWHGFHQDLTPWMDGVGFISQPPILPGAYFDYIFNVSEPGSYWYHSHVGAQRTDGLFGAFIVKEAKGKTINDYEELTGGEEVEDKPQNHTLTLLDWERESSLSVFVRIHSTLGFFPNNEIGRVPSQFVSLNNRSRSIDGVEVGPVPFWSGLINGKGRHTRETYSVLSEFKVNKGHNYRFRLIGAQSLYAFKFSIDMHKLTVIASDSRFIKPRKVDYIIIHAGERYDFILHADQEVSNYWIRAETLEANVRDTHLAEAILHYEGAEEPDPWNKYVDIKDRKRTCSWRRKCSALNCPFKEFPYSMHTSCIHLDQIEAFSRSGDEEEEVPPHLLPADDDNQLFFNFGFEGRSLTSAINGFNFHLPTTPYQTYCDQYDADLNNKDGESEDGVCHLFNPTPEDDDKSVDYLSCIHVRTIAQSAQYQRDQKSYPSINFVLSAVGNIDKKLNDFSHPIHLHGHHFRVIAVEHGEYNRDKTLKDNNKDVTCGNLDGETDLRCHNPKWANGLPHHLEKFHNPKRVKNAVLKDTVIVPAGG